PALQRQGGEKSPVRGWRRTITGTRDASASHHLPHGPSTRGPSRVPGPPLLEEGRTTASRRAKARAQAPPCLDPAIRCLLPAMPKRDVDKRKTTKALRKLRRAADRATEQGGPGLTTWEKDFVEGVSGRLEKYG